MQIEELQAFCEQVCVRTGLPAEDARAVAEVLVTTDSWGTHTHDTKQLRSPLKSSRDGKMDLRACAEMVAEGPAWAVFDGRHSMPMTSALRAMRTAVEKARGAGVGYATVRNSGH